MPFLIGATTAATTLLSMAFGQISAGFEACGVLLAAAGWAGETDWTILRRRPVDDLAEEEAIRRLARSEKMIDPKLYPKIKGALGVFRLTQARVENHIIVTRALAGDSDRAEVKLKPTDFADYLIYNALR